MWVCMYLSIYWRIHTSFQTRRLFLLSNNNIHFCYPETILIHILLFPSPLYRCNYSKLNFLPHCHIWLYIKSLGSAKGKALEVPSGMFEQIRSKTKVRNFKMAIVGNTLLVRAWEYIIIFRRKFPKPSKKSAKVHKISWK